MTTQIEPRLVLGTADLRDDGLTPRLLDRFYERGGCALDVANVYGDGASSRAVGRWLEQTGRREALRLYVKGCHPPFCSPALVASEIEPARSLLRLEVLDVFMLHRDDPEVSVEAFAGALRDEVDQGTITSFGVSNWTLPRFDALAAHLGGDAVYLTTFSNHFSLATMVTPTWPGCLAMTRADIGALETAGVTPLAWASLAGGYFAGRDISSWTDSENEQRRIRARQLADELGTSVPAIALAYVLAQSRAMLAAVGTRRERHLDDLLAATSIHLSPAQIAWLHG